MNEEEANNKLEELVGNVDGCFRLMRLYEHCVQAASSNKFTLRKLPTVEERFRRSANAAGYSNDVVNHYLNYVR